MIKAVASAFGKVSCDKTIKFNTSAITAATASRRNAAVYERHPAFDDIVSIWMSFQILPCRTDDPNASDNFELKAAQFDEDIISASTSTTRLSNE